LLQIAAGLQTPQQATTAPKQISLTADKPIEFALALHLLEILFRLNGNVTYGNHLDYGRAPLATTSIAAITAETDSGSSNSTTTGQKSEWLKCDLRTFDNLTSWT
jgi:hypothetical protein